MTIVIRHNGESHAVRPDGVYATSVTQSGWQPGDVMMIANAFTARPQGLDGLHGWRDWNPFRKLGLFLKSAFARKKAGELMVVGQGTGVGDPSGGDAKEAANQIAPQIRAQMQFLAQLHNPEARGLAAALAAWRNRRLNSYYRAG